MRRAAVLVLVAALASAILTSPVSARPGGVYVESVTSEGVVCRTTTTDGSLQVQARLVRDTYGADFFQLQAFNTSGPGNLAFEAYGFPAHWSDGSVRGSGGLIDNSGRPIPGKAVMSADFHASGPPITEVVTAQEGNQRQRATITTTTYSIAHPAITVTGLTLNPLDCIGNYIATKTAYTTPATYVVNQRSLETIDARSCYLPGRAEVFAKVKGRELSIVLSNLAEPYWLAEANIHLHGSSGSGPLDVFDTGTAPVATGSATALLAQSGPPVTQSFSEENVVVVRTVTPYSLRVALELPYGSFSTRCKMELVQSRFRVHLGTDI